MQTILFLSAYGFYLPIISICLWFISGFCVHLSGGFMVSICLWFLSVHDVYLTMVSICLLFHSFYLSMVSICLWFLSVYGLYLSMVSICLWFLSVYGLYLSMVYICRWFISVYGLYLSMVSIWPDILVINLPGWVSMNSFYIYRKKVDFLYLESVHCILYYYILYSMFPLSCWVYFNSFFCFL